MSASDNFQKVEGGYMYTFCGWLIRSSDGDNDIALYVIDHRPKVDKWNRQVNTEFKPLAEQVYEATGFGVKQVSISYHITDVPFSEDALTAMVIGKMCGVSLSGEIESQYYHRYSEKTGYLWTDEHFKVGGHDVLLELSGSLGKWLHLNVLVHKRDVTK